MSNSDSPGVAATSSRPAAFGSAVLEASIRSVPEDFIVEEILGFEPTGQGEHLFLVVEKIGANTAWVAQQLARWAGVHERAVGYAGLKDRHAVTRQTFTVHMPGRAAPALDELLIPGVRLLSSDWHQRKLPRGALRGNRFVLTLRDIQGEHSAIEERLAQIVARGVPNWFGEQRFGRDGGNLSAARAMFAGRRMPRDKRSIYLSAARSELFNRILAERIRRGAWDAALPGEVFMLDGTHSVFGPVPLNQEIEQRLQDLDIHPTGAMWGAGELRSEADVHAIESSVASADLELAEGLVAAGLKQERRALRMPVRGLLWRWVAENLVLEFELPAGGYATTVLQALGELRDRARLGG